MAIQAARPQRRSCVVRAHGNVQLQRWSLMPRSPARSRARADAWTYTVATPPLFVQANVLVCAQLHDSSLQRAVAAAPLAFRGGIKYICTSSVVFSQTSTFRRRATR